MTECEKCKSMDAYRIGKLLCEECWERESSIHSTDLLCEIMRIADHQIPGYAFGDNQAACDMDMRLREIYMTLAQHTHNAGSHRQEEAGK